MKRLFKILRNLVLGAVGLVVLALVLVNLTPVQNFLAREAAKQLAKKLKTEVRIGHVRIDFLNHVLIQGLQINDRQGQVLLSAGEARVRITDWFLFRDEVPVLRYVGLHDANVHLYRTSHSPVWNYQFIEDAFDTGKKDTSKKQNEFKLDLERLDLKRVRFWMDDSWAGSDKRLDIGSLQLAADEIDLKKRRAAVHSLDIDKANFYIHDYTGGRPPRPKRIGPPPVDSTAFNPGNWVLSAGNIRLNDCRFALKSAEGEPMRGAFDSEHMDIKDVDLDVSNVRITGDTLTARLAHLGARDRSGVNVKHMSAEITVSPVLSECKNLRLEVGNSVLGDYYAMHYSRFPDFEDYIENVRMVAQLKGSKVDVQDIAYFAPQLKPFRRRLSFSGAFDGTVAKFRTKSLDVTDGESRVRGDLAMTGLPNIDRTIILYQNGSLFTSGPAILRWAPQLRGNPSLALEQVQYAFFNGSFAGSISAFATAGTLRTNLGTVVSDVRLKLPPGASRTAAYEGVVRTDAFQIGRLLRIPQLGSITLRANIDGIGFDPDYAQILLDAQASRIDAYGYSYRNISANGLLARKHFQGKGVIDDPNLALAFDGAIDFNGSQPVIAAKANLLKSNFKALGLTKDSLLLAADFDLTTTGSNLDNFLGNATLYNINLLRSGTRLDLDSIRVRSSLDAIGRRLDITSNALTAHLAGQFRLSDLPTAMEYYLAGYLPNYVRINRRPPPAQDVAFGIQTRSIDKLLTVLLPGIRGFDSSSFSGFLRTNTQELSLTAKVPYGNISGVIMQGVDLTANGNFDKLTVKGSSSTLDIGKGAFTAAVDFKAAVGSDSLDFSITTTSPEVYGTATLHGNAYARGDSLYGTLRPSELLVNGDRWEILGGNSIVLSTDYLMVRNLQLQSGLQRIVVNSAQERTGQNLVALVENIDLSRLGGLLGIAGYQPDGRINGSIQAENLFRKSVSISTDLSAKSVKMGADTVGDVTIIGRYEPATGLLQLDPRSGIRNGAATVSVGGTLSSDSTSSQRLAGTIELSDAPVSWIAPFTTGSLSNLSGSLRGRILIGGSASRPEVSGSVTLHGVSLRVDYIGTTYRIPFAAIVLRSNVIDVGTVTLYDRFGNSGEVTGTVTHRNFENFRFALDLNTSRLEMLNLRDFENALYYGNLVASASVTVRGTADNLQMNVLRGTPVEAGHLYLPIGSTGAAGSYSFVSFKQYGENAEVKRPKKSLRFSLNMDIIANPLAEVTMILDPSTGDAINARGSGPVRLELPSGSDVRMFGNYFMESGDYTFTLRQVAFKRKFNINSGSTISFSGPISQTKLNVEAIYPTYARLYDLLDSRQVETLPDNERSDAKTNQRVDLLLRMRGSLVEPTLGFDIDLPERRSIGTVAEAELRRIKLNERELFDQVASLLLIGTFVPSQGIVNSTARAGAINNVSEILSTNVSGQLTNIVNKILGDNKIALDLKYKNYNLADASSQGGGIANRNEVKLGLRRNFFNNRLIVELGTAYDWGRPVGNATSSNFNPVGDFRLQYLLTEEGRVRLNVFRTSNYDVLANDNISRSGAGLSYRKTFDSFDELLHGKHRPLLQQGVLPIQPPAKQDTLGSGSSTD